jgi:hypothetical protein
MQPTIFIALLTLFVPLVASTYTSPSSGCNKNEFWWDDKKCCLPSGGPPKPPSPPKGSNCPPTSYYWSNDRGCCAPRNPPPANPPPPQCPQGWQWSKSLWRCSPTPTPPTPPTPHPSPKPPNVGNNGNNNGNNNKGYNRRSQKSRSHQPLCPTDFDACPVTGPLDGDDYECVDFATELEFCGGCPALGAGQDCSTIEGAWNVGCDQGSCVVYTCAGGYELGADGKSCILA